MHIIFVHGWSVTNTSSYGDLPEWLAKQGPQFKIQNVYLGKYISFVDVVTLDDIARAFQQALLDALGPKMNEGFACITHSTGGPVVRLWIKLFHEARLAACPLKHLIMLAPANHGSALAQLGRGIMSRFEKLLEGVQPGTRVLDWLELGSESSWSLNESWLGYDCLKARLYPFVLTGQSIDRAFYDHLNSYTDEPGSDGVVRASSANMNYGLLRLSQEGEKAVEKFVRPRFQTAFGILPGRSHSGETKGIIRSVKRQNADQHPTAQWVRRCLQVASSADYNALAGELKKLTEKTQEDESVEKEKKLFGTKTYETSRYCMLVFRFVDDRGDTLTDYDLYITGGPNYSPDDLPKGFFVDRQRNKRSVGKLTYYLDYDALRKGLSTPKMQGCIGFTVVARPEKKDGGLVYYDPLNYKSNLKTIGELLGPNQTLMVEVTLQRRVDTTVFRIEDNLKPSDISKKPSGRIVPGRLS